MHKRFILYSKILFQMLLNNISSLTLFKALTRYLLQLINRVFFIIIITFCCCCSPTKEVEQLKDELNEQQIIFIMEKNAPPISYFNENGEQIGLFVDYVNIFEKKFEIEADILYFDSWSELLKYAQENTGYIIGGAAKTPKREEYLKFSSPLVKIPYIILTPKRSKVKSLTDLLGQRICTVKDYAVNDYLKSHTDLNNMVYVENNIRGIRGVATGEFDAMIVNQIYATYLIEQQGISNLKIAGESGYYNELCLAISKKDVKLYELINTLVNQLSNKNRKEIYNRWVFATVRQLSAKTIRALIIIGGGIVILFVFIWLLVKSLREQVAIKTQQIIQEESKYKFIIENSYDAICIHYNGVVHLLNKRFEKLFGFTEKQFLTGQITINEILFQRDSTEKNIKHQSIEKEFISHQCEFIGITKTGERLFLDVSVSYYYLEVGMATQLIIHDITKRKLKEIELNEYRHRLEELVSERTEELLVANEEIIAVNRELVKYNKKIEKKNEELKQQKSILENTLFQLKETQSTLFEAEKMASLGILTSGVAHEINNPLNFISGTYYGLKKLLENNTFNIEDRDMLLENLKFGVDRVSEIVKGLNEFSRGNISNREQCDLHKIIENCLVILSHKLKKGIKIKRFYSNTPFIIIGNVGKLHQVYLNVLINAIESIKNQGEISIKCLYGTNTLITKIIDSGVGIKPESLSRVTEPFYTTKDPGKGTGLGLSICYNIVKEHNGQLKFSSVIGKGTEVQISFPHQLKINRNKNNSNN